MILLYGKSPSGKTEYFLEKYKGEEVKILHASSLTELRNKITSTQSLLNDPLPTLINVWYDLDCLQIQDLQNYDVFIEAHYFETATGLMVKGSGNGRYYYGLRNETKMKERKLFIRKSEAKNQANIDWVAILGTRYNYFKSLFPEIVR